MLDIKNTPKSIRIKPKKDGVTYYIKEETAVEKMRFDNKISIEILKRTEPFNVVITDIFDSKIGTLTVNDYGNPIPYFFVNENVERLTTAPKEQCETGTKYDTGKPRLFEMIEDFKEPLEEVAKVWAFGADKYKKHNWAYVDNAYDRYSNALVRHLVQGKTCDDESKLLHAAHVAWNSLARLHFILEEQKEKHNNAKTNEPE